MSCLKLGRGDGRNPGLSVGAQVENLSLVWNDDQSRRVLAIELLEDSNERSAVAAQTPEFHLNLLLL